MDDPQNRIRELEEILDKIKPRVIEMHDIIDQLRATNDRNEAYAHTVQVLLAEIGEQLDVYMSLRQIDIFLARIRALGVVVNRE